MAHTVEKIGGTSIANTSAVFENILIGDRCGEDLYNRIFVVSAYSGMTDLLLEHKKTNQPGVFGLFANAQNKWAWSDALTDLSVAMRAKNAEVFGGHSDCETADGFVLERIEGIRNCLIDLHRLCSYGQFRLDDHLMTVREMLAALGEAQSAHNTAMLLRQRGVEATFIDLTGWRDDNAITLEERIEHAFENVDVNATLPITTGYANCVDGMIAEFDRGYTEVTFAKVAALTGAEQAIIHKEFHLSSADPKLVGEDRVQKIGETNYDVADQLSNMGMEAVHPRAAKVLRQADIPLCVRNTFDPEDPGTIIRSDFSPETPRAEIVTGLKNVLAVEVFEQDMVGVKGYDAGILEALTRHKISIVSKCSNANTVTHFVNASRKGVKRACADIERAFPSASVTARKVCIVSVIGADLDVPGVTAAATAGLHDAGVALLGIIQITRNTDLQMIIPEEDHDRAIKKLHQILIEQNSQPKAVNLQNAA